MLNIEKINDEYFGEDKRKRYLKYDFETALRGLIVRRVLIELLLELSKSRSSKKELPDGSVSFGDFDLDGAGFFANIFEVYQRGWMLNIRQLLTPNEKGAGGKFIKDVQRLTVNDFMDFYTKQNTLKDPPFLARRIMREKPKNYADFVRNSYKNIEAVVDNLINKATKFNNNGYFSKIIFDYQALEFHKDFRPEKYDLRKELVDPSFPYATIITRRPKSGIKIQEIAKCLNDFAEIISIYQSLVSQNTSFISSNWPLEIFIDKTLAFFAKKIPRKTRKK